MADGEAGESAEAAQDVVAERKTRRQTAVYPMANKTAKPFSRSAAKRESVMTLGSIEHLQHYFTKTGLAAKKKHVHTVLLLNGVG